MIGSQKYKEVLDSGLMLDHYFLLCSIKNGEKVPNTKRVQGFLNLLIKKDYVKDDAITEKGLNLVENCEFATQILVKDKGNIDLGSWASNLHALCQDKLVKLTGSKQVMAKMENGKKGGYPFLCNATDMTKALGKIIILYKLTDYDKIQKTVLNFIDRCYNTSHWFPLMQYYIIKENKSLLVTDLDADEQDLESSGFVSTQKLV